MLGHAQRSIQLQVYNDSYADLQHMAMPAPTREVLLAAMTDVVRTVAAEHMDPLSVEALDGETY